MEQKLHGNNYSSLIRYWLPNKIFKVMGGCHPDFGSSSIYMSSKVEENYNFNRLQLIRQLRIPYNEVWILSVTWCLQRSIEWDRTRLAITIQRRCDLGSQKTFKFSAWCYSDVGSLSIPIILKLKKTITTCLTYSDNCRFRMAIFEFLICFTMLYD